MRVTREGAAMELVVLDLGAGELRVSFSMAITNSTTTSVRTPIVRPSSDRPPCRDPRCSPIGRQFPARLSPTELHAPRRPNGLFSRGLAPAHYNSVY